MRLPNCAEHCRLSAGCPHMIVLDCLSGEMSVLGGRLKAEASLLIRLVLMISKSIAFCPALVELVHVVSHINQGGL